MYGNERGEAQALDELEAVLRQVADELAAWRARALKAEGDLKGQPKAATPAKAKEPAAPAEGRREANLSAENDVLKRRVEAARVRVQELLGRLSFLEEQSRNGSGGNGGGGGGGSRR